MGRSKFPGKPPKTVTRKRIKVLGCWPGGQQNESTIIPENIYNHDLQQQIAEKISENEKESILFPTKDSKFTCVKQKSQESSKNAEKTSPVETASTTTTTTSTTTTTTNPEDGSKANKSVESTENPLPENCPTDESSKIDEKEDSRRSTRTNKPPRVCKRVKFNMGTPVLKSVNNILDRHQRTRQLRNSTAKRLLQRAKFNISTTNRSNSTQTSDKPGNVRKFILPMRSAHSSRVIKPNKRFIEELEESPSGEMENTKKFKVTSTDQSNNCENIDNKPKKSRKVTENPPSSDASHQPMNHRKCREISRMKTTGVSDAKCTVVPSKVLPDAIVESSRVQTRSNSQAEIAEAALAEAKNEKRNEEKMDVEEEEEEEEEEGDDDDELESLSEDSNSEQSEDDQSEWSGMKLDGGKVILRKARLKLDNKNEQIGGTEGPFSVTNPQNSVTNPATANNNLTGTVKCGVCGAVRFYRFVKQARKFGIHSCESCRKFISKMIKRQACAKANKSTLPMLQCHKGDGLCLVPPVVRSQQWNLMRCVYKARCPACWLKMCLKCYHIPATLKSGLNALLPPLMRDPVIALGAMADDADILGQRTLGWPAEDSMEKNLFKSAMSWSGIDICKDGIAGISPAKIEQFEEAIVSPSKKRKKDNRIKVRKKSKSPVPIAQPLRQRVDLKGPRVKHVCRSASVALGQPIATFPEAADAINKSTVTKTSKDDDKSEKRDEIVVKEPQKTNNQENNVNSNNNVQQQVSTKRSSKSQQNLLAPSHQVVRALPKPTMASNTIHTISIDFWEQYDPAEVGAKGFALIASENFHIPAICFLCGSAGKEPLIHCQCCCEPYHPYCLEPSEWNACAQPNWCCPRCTICQTCHLRVGPKLSCMRCRQSFHHACLSKSGVNARLYSSDGPYVCQSCVKCKSCGSEGVSVYVGNLPLCSMCFKLRQRGNYCPLCQRCYNENDFDSKMMECNECSCWVHARCEGLSDEYYQVLSYLPDSIEFTCSQCSPSPNSVWRNAIESELKAGFISVIKALSKNRKMCAALKWSPRKECLCKPLASVRRLDFSEERSSRDSTEDTEEPLENPEKVDPLSRFDFEIDDQPIDLPRRGLRRLKQKFHLKECSVRVKNCVVKEDEESECQCSEQQIIARPSPTLLSVKRKVNGNEYRSLFQFHCDMEHVVNRAGAEDLMETYHKSLQEVFPWFDPKRSKISSSGSAMSTPSKDSCKDSPMCKLDDSILETWKEEVLKAPKAIAAKTGNLYSNLTVEDTRSCALCKGLGDGQGTREGRLLYCGQNEWVHSNCALWSNEVFEEIDGSLQNVHSAISRGKQIRCSECGKKGASVGCCAKNCSSTYHFPCARNSELGFNDDETIFCSSHLSHCATKTPHNDDDFELKRLVYVELDRKKKKFVEPDQVRVMIGSLIIDCLGTVVPEFSDTSEKILPTNFKCSRLYWSTVNPMKLVKYYIRTYVQHCTAEISQDAEHNVTIDHSKELERQKLEQLVVKQTLDAVIDSVYNEEVDENLAEQNNGDLLPPEITDVIFQDLPHDLLDGISMQDIFPKMSYEDFLAMDLKGDGVFGNDLLKDDMLSSDVDEMIKPSEKVKMDSGCPDAQIGAQNDLWVHLETKGCVQELVDDLMNSKSQKIGGRELKRSKSEVISNNHLAGQRHHQRSCSLTWSCKLDGTYGPTMKRRKLPRTASRTPGECNEVQTERSMFNELRIPESIMLAVGRANTPNIMAEANKDHKRLLWHTRQQPRIVQVDGPADPSSASECSSPEYNMDERIPQIDGSWDIKTAESRFCFGREPCTEKEVSFNDERSCAQIDQEKSLLCEKSDDSAMSATSLDDEQTTQIDVKSRSEESDNPFLIDESSSESFKIPQLDGADDISSDDENPQQREPKPQLSAPIMTIGEGPVTCKRCQCTYRTQDSYNRHLITCDIVTTSDSDSETIDNKGASPNSRFSDSIGSLSPQFITMSPSEGHTLSSEYPDMQVTSPLEASVPSPHQGIQIEPIAQALITPQIHTHSTVETVHQTVLTSNDVIVQTQYTRTTTTLPNRAVLPESTVQITEITDTASNTEATIAPNLSPRGTVEGCTLPETVASPQVSPTGSTASSSACSATAESPSLPLQPSKPTKPKSPRTPKPRTKMIKPQMIRNTAPQQLGQVRYQTVQNTAPVLQLQQPQRPAAPTVILQPSGLMSYVETLQQQSNQNLQYITAIGGQESSYKPQFITTNQLVPGAYIQAASDNLLALPNGGISVLPGVQIAQPQPTVLGTIIQQQPNTIQCGVISSEQLVLSSTPTLEMFTDSTGSMFVSSQPMYYGLETIVSNTVMSSSQFMTGAVPQVLASSYQTTTQVFQASKLMEPMVEVPNVQTVQGIPGGYVVVNPTAQEPMQNRQITVPQEQSFVRNQCNPTPVEAVPSVRTVPEVIRTVPGVRTVPEVRTAPEVLRTVPEVRTHTEVVRTVPEVRTVPQALGTVPEVRSYVEHHQQQQQQQRPFSPPRQPSSIPRVAVRPSPVTVTQSNQWKLTEPLYEQNLSNNTRQNIANNTRPYLDSKHVSENTSMIKSSLSSKIPPLSSHCVTQRDLHHNKLNIDVNSVNVYNNGLIDSGIVNGISGINSVINGIGGINSVISGNNQKTTAPTTRPMNRVLPMQAVAKEIIKPVQRSDIIIEEPRKPEIKGREEVKSSLEVRKEILELEKYEKSNTIVSNVEVKNNIDLVKDIEFEKTIDFTKSIDFTKNVEFTKNVDYGKNVELEKNFTVEVKNIESDKTFTLEVKNVDFCKNLEFGQNIDFEKNTEFQKSFCLEAKDIIEKPFTIQTPIVEEKHELNLENNVVGQDEKILEKSIEKLIEAPIEKSLEKLIDEPIEKSVENTIEQLIDEPIEKSFEKSIEKLIEEPIEKSFEKSIEKLIEEPITKSFEKSLEGLIEESVEKRPEKIVEQPIIEIPIDEQKVIEEAKIITSLPKDEKTNSETPLKLEDIEESKENLKLDIDKDKLKNASLKIVLQKQLQDGSYKISHNMKSTTQTKATPKITSVEILPSKQTPQIGALQLLPIKSFTLKANKIEEKPRLVDKNPNLPEPKAPPIAVKKPRFIAKNAKINKIEPPTANLQKKTGPSLMYEIKSQDGFTHTASSMAEVWETVFKAVQAARKAHNLPPLSHNPLAEGLGLENNATVYLVEQLAGVNRCTKYKPRFHNLTPPKSPDNDVLAESDHGAARAEPFKGRKVHDMFSWLASRHRQQPKMIAISENEMRKAASTNLPMAMRFRILKETSKESVGVYHSHIHGRGLFCLRDIEAGEMVIEYAGEVIRASLTDKREKYYDSKNIGCYMFKIDDHLVVDATMKGNAARFINHSCEPNCYSRVVDILGKKHILIFALRRIVQGEELTYDYKFPFEDVKIPCTCGSRRCRKYLN